MRMILKFSTATLKVRIQWKNTFKILKENYFQRILLLANYLSEEIK